jgi:hypothetical protein
MAAGLCHDGRMTRGVRRIVATAVAVAALAAGAAACHEHFESPSAFDLAKEPETFGFDLSAESDDDLGVPHDMTVVEHHDLANRDAT